MSSTMRTTGKRTLAGIAAGALAFAGLALVAAPSAQAAQTIAAYCVGNSTGTNGNAGNGLDPTTVQPNCSLNAGASAVTEIATSTFVGSTVAWVRYTVTGNSTFDDTNSAWPITPVLSADKKTISIPATNAVRSDALNVVDLFVPSAGVRTVSVFTSTVNPGGLTVPADNQFTERGDFTVTGLGASVQAVVSQGYYAVSAAAYNSAVDDTDVPIGLVHLVDESGNVIPTTGAVVTNVVSNAASGTIGNLQYAAGDCVPSGAGAGLLSGATIDDAGATADAGIITDACATAVGAGVANVANSGMWITLNPGNGAGNHTVSFTLVMPNGAVYPASINYTVSAPVAGAWTLGFNQSTYTLGADGFATFTLKDLSGLTVPDGLGWFGEVRDDTRSVDWMFNNVLTVNAFAYEDDTNNMPTYNGENFLVFEVPANPMTSFTLTAEAIPGAGWASTQVGAAKSATASIGDPTPPAAESIMIVGTRGVGDDANRVYVEGTTTNLVGKTVTPYFRFPGETGFTAGTGVRTVDAQGNFAWQRKTGKKIAIQFRAGDGVVSNSIIIEAK